MILQNINKIVVFFSIFFCLFRLYTMEQPSEMTKKEEEQKKTIEPPSLIKQTIKVISISLLDLIEEQGIIDQIVNLVKNQKTREEMQPFLDQLSPATQKKVLDYINGIITEDELPWPRHEALDLIKKFPWELRAQLVEYLLTQVFKTQIWIDKERKNPFFMQNPDILFQEQSLINQSLEQFIIDLINEADEVTDQKKRQDIQKEFAKYMLAHQEVFSTQPLLLKYIRYMVLFLDKLPEAYARARDILILLLETATEKEKFDALYFLLFKIATLDPDFENYENTLDLYLKHLNTLLSLGINPQQVLDEHNKSILIYVQEWKEQKGIPYGTTQEAPITLDALEKAIAILKKYSK